MFISRPSSLDGDQFSPSLKNPSALYGLKSQVERCTRCGQSNQMPGSTVEFKSRPKDTKRSLNITSNICDACKFAETKKSIDWDAREEQLRSICDKFRKNNGEYDCLVPGSGGKDSFYQAYLLKYKYGMNPLTCTWAPHIYTEWGRSNHQAWIDAGFDNILFTPNGGLHRFLTRLSFDTLLHPFQPFIIGQYNLAPKVAIQHNINLIFYGECGAEYNNPIEDTLGPEKSLEFFVNDEVTDLHLSGHSIDSFLKEGISLNDLRPYLPISNTEARDKNIRVLYLGYFEKWHPQSLYYFATDHGGFTPSPTRNTGTYSRYASIDDKFDDLHFHTAFIKFGVGRASHDATQEVRSGDLSYEESKALIQKYDGEFPDRWIDELLAYMSMEDYSTQKYAKFFECPVIDRDYYQKRCDTFRSPHLWMLQEDKWKLRQTGW